MKQQPLEEKRTHSTVFVPYSYYHCTLSEHFKYVPLHWHREFEISYISEGTGCFRCENNLITGCKGDIIIIPPNTPHSVMRSGTRSVCYDTLVFNKNLLSDPSGSRAYIELLQPIIDGRLKFSTRISKNNCRYMELKTAIENIISCAKKNSAKYDLLMKCELLRLVWLLLESEETHYSVSETARCPEGIRKAIDFILDNYPDNITIEQLADVAHLSKSCFMDKFKRETGQSAVTYINGIRIKNACEILISTNKSASLAAFESGFRNISNFNRQFLKYVGCSPSKYRKILISAHHEETNTPSD